MVDIDFVGILEVACFSLGHNSLEVASSGLMDNLEEASSAKAFLEEESINQDTFIEDIVVAFVLLELNFLGFSPKEDIKMADLLQCIGPYFN